MRISGELFFFDRSKADSGKGKKKAGGREKTCILKAPYSTRWEASGVPFPSEHQRMRGGKGGPFPYETNIFPLVEKHFIGINGKLKSHN